MSAANFTQITNNKRGYSLAELMIVVAIIGTLASYAKFNYSASNSRLNQAARDLYSNMQKIRMEAIKRYVTWGIICDNATETYVLCAYDTNTSTCDGDNTTISLTDDYSSGIQFGYGSATIPVSGTLPTSGISYTNLTTYFDPQGLSPKKGYIYLQNDKGSTVAIGTSSLAGVVRIRKWNGISWD